MSSTHKSKRGPQEQEKAKGGKEKEEKLSLPQVNGRGNKAGNNNTTPNKKANDQSKSVQAEKLPAIKVAKTAATPEIPVDPNPPTLNEMKKEETVENKEGNNTITTTTQEISNPANTEVPIVTVPEAVPVVEVPSPPVKPPQNGKVTLIYEQYNEQFDILNGSTTHENIDEVYCLTFVMPNCLIHLSKLNPQEKRKLEAEGNLDFFIEENPRGTYHGLEVDMTYYVYVEQEAEQLARDQARMKQIASSMEGAKKKDPNGDLVKDDGRVLESCSCIYGNPCVDEYGCKDWDNRFAVATKNGWKGF